MKNSILLIAVASVLALASCGGEKKEETVAVDTTVVATDTAAAVVADSAVADTTVKDTAAVK